jgi:uncharacterized RDD family membrane protein YckC
MHQRRRVHTGSLSRFVGAGLAAVVVAVTLTVTMGWSPICAIYTPSDPEYWVFMCWYDPPPHPPEG